MKLSESIEKHLTGKVFITVGSDVMRGNGNQMVYLVHKVNGLGRSAICTVIRAAMPKDSPDTGPHLSISRQTVAIEDLMNVEEFPIERVGQHETGCLTAIIENLHAEFGKP